LTRVQVPVQVQKTVIAKKYAIRGYLFEAWTEVVCQKIGEDHVHKVYRVTVDRGKEVRELVWTDRFNLDHNDVQMPKAWSLEFFELILRYLNDRGRGRIFLLNQLTEDDIKAIFKKVDLRDLYYPELKLEPEEIKPILEIPYENGKIRYYLVFLDQLDPYRRLYAQIKVIEVGNTVEAYVDWYGIWDVVIDKAIL